MYEQAFQEEKDTDSIGQTQWVPDDLRKHYPNVALVLSGRLGSKKEKRPAIPPATIIVFARDGGLGFIIAPREYHLNAHGFIEEPVAILDQLEDQLEKGRVGWKPAKRK